MNKQCPKCGKWTVKFDSYFHRDRCMMRDCGWISKSKPVIKEMNKTPFCKKCGGNNLAPDPTGYGDVDFVDDEGRSYFCIDCDKLKY